MELVKKGGIKVDRGTQMDPSERGHDPKDAPKEPGDAKPEGSAIPDPKGALPKGGTRAQDPKDAAKPLYQCSMDGAVREGPGPCPTCKMVLTEKDRLKSGAPKGKDGKPAEDAKPVVPPKEEYVPETRKPDVAKPPGMKPDQGPLAAAQGDSHAPREFVYKCPMDGAIRETPGACPKCGMMLDERHKVPKPKVERTIYVCDVHPEEVYDKPGQCFKESCAGMVLEARKIVPGAKLIYVCPVHPDVTRDKPGVCPKENCGKKLGYKIVSEATRLSEVWACPLHPQMTAGGKLQCPECGREMKHLEVEQMLAVPYSAVIDTGTRKVVFIDKGHGTFDAAEITVGPRAGEYYPVLKGLAAGDRVVTAGAFLLDAETRLNPAAGVIYFGATGQGDKK